MSTESTPPTHKPNVKLTALGTRLSMALFERKQEGPNGTFTRVNFVLSKQIADRESGEVSYREIPLFPNEIPCLLNLLREVERGYLIRTDINVNGSSEREPESVVATEDATAET